MQPKYIEIDGIQYPVDSVEVSYEPLTQDDLEFINDALNDSEAVEKATEKIRKRMGRPTLNGENKAARQMVTRVSDDIYTFLEEEARRRDVNKSIIVREALESYKEQHGKAA